MLLMVRRKMLVIVDRSVAIVMLLGLEEDRGLGMGRRCIGPDFQEKLVDEDILTCSS